MEEVLLFLKSMKSLSELAIGDLLDADCRRLLLVAREARNGGPSIITHLTVNPQYNIGTTLTLTGLEHFGRHLPELSTLRLHTFGLPDDLTNNLPHLATMARLQELMIHGINLDSDFYGKIFYSAGEANGSRAAAAAALSTQLASILNACPVLEQVSLAKLPMLSAALYPMVVDRRFHRKRRVCQFTASGRLVLSHHRQASASGRRIRPAHQPAEKTLSSTTLWCA